MTKLSLTDAFLYGVDGENKCLYNATKQMFVEAKRSGWMNNCNNSENENPFVDNVQHVPVPVIASFNKEGKVIPLYFSVEGIKLRVDNIKWENTGKMWGNHYKCEVTLGERVEEVDLYYFAESRKWTMKKKY